MPATLWDDLPMQEQAARPSLWDDLPMQAQQPKPFNILPASEDAQGNISFDSNAGLLGAIKRAVTLPGDVFTGKVDPKSDEGIGRALELGATMSPLNPGIRMGDRAIPGAMRQMRPQKIEPPSAQALKDAGSAGYDRLRDMGVDYSSDAVRGLAGALRHDMEKDGILAELAPKTFKLIRKLENPPEGSVASISGIEAARRAFGNLRRDFANPTEQEAASPDYARAAAAGAASVAQASDLV